MRLAWPTASIQVEYAGGGKTRVSVSESKRGTQGMDKVGDSLSSVPFLLQISSACSPEIRLEPESDSFEEADPVAFARETPNDPVIVTS